MARLARFTNNATSRLAGNLSAGGLTLTVTPGDGAKFPSLSGGQYFMATLVKADGTKEIVKVTARATDTLTIQRAAEAVGGVQTAFSFSAGDKIELRLTAGALSNELDRLDLAALTRAANKSANYTVAESDISTLIRVDTSGGARTITLPQISTLTDAFEIVVTKVTADTNLVNVTVTGGDTINGGSTYSLSSAFQSAWVIADRATNTWTAINSGTGFVSVKDFGVVGDGVTDDAAALNAAGALGIPLFIPYTSTGYKIGSTVTFSCSVVCEGFFTPTSAIGAAGNDYDRFAIILASSGYAQKRRFVGIKVVGSVALRAANVSGIRNDCENSYSQGLHVSQLNYGIVARSYSQTYDKCNANQCNTNLDGYARSASLEINALTIIGGNYDSPVVRSMRLGDTTWSDAWGGSNYHGSVIWIGGGANFDGGEIKVDWCTSVKFDTGYSETSVSNYGIVLGGGADGSVRNVDIANWFFKTMRIAVKCLSAVDGLVVRRNFYTGVTHSALYLVSDLYHAEYHKGDATASFTQGREVHTGFRFLAPSQIGFANLTIPHLGLYRGVQQISQDVGDCFPGFVLRSSNTAIKTDASGSNLRRYTAGQSGIGGTVAAGGAFTCTVTAQCAAFNGGDQVTLNLGGASYVRYVDYENGVIYLDGASSTGAATLSQINSSGRTETLGTAAPTTGTWVRCDRVVNITPAVGQPKAWVCTVAGTPGTWVSEGNL